MIVLKVRNVHHALHHGVGIILRDGREESSRNGDVLRMKEPVATVYEKPDERVETHAWRDSNPFFHFYESLWMMAGRRDVAPLAKYVRRMRDFSDDGEIFNAAYGWRWRRNGQDQPVEIIRALRNNPRCRQQVLQIWDHRLDLGTATKDHACNVSATFQLSVDGRLDMALFCRSNDMIWGAYGANAVHFSVLHEFVALATGLPLGVLTQISVNMHAYRSVLSPMAARRVRTASLYERVGVSTRQLMRDRDEWEWWLRSCEQFVTIDGRAPAHRQLGGLHPYFEHIAYPIVLAHDAYADGRTLEEIDAMLVRCQADDWRTACWDWIQRRRGA